MKNMKKSSFLGMLLCIAIVFSCTNAPGNDVVITGKRTLAIPTFTTENSKVEYGTVIKFDYSPNDAQLYYTTDGSDPDIDDDDSFYYDPSKGIKLTESCTIKARLYHSNYNPSPVVGKDFKLYISEPVITANQDVTEITTSDEITISHDSKMVKIYYTTDGSEPTEDMDEYEGPFTFDKAGIYVVKAIAVRGGIKSKTVIKSYTVMAGAYLDTLKVEAEGKNYLENFKKSESNYTINVPNAVTSVNVVAESDSCTVNGGNGTYNLPEGETTSITIFVTSKKDSNTYTVNIYRAPAKASDDATLSVLELHAPGLVAFDKTFAGNVFDYTAHVDSTVSSVTLTFATNHPKAVADVKSGATYILDKDEKDLSVTVTAEDADATETYNVKVIKNPIEDDNANLKSLTVADNPVVPVSNYMTFTTSESKVQVVAKAENENASVKIDGKSLTALEVNVPGTVSIEITAEDGKTVKNYTLELKKVDVPVVTAKLTSVTVNGETVTPNSAMSYTSKTTTADIVITAENASSSIIDGKAGTTANVTISADGKTASKAVVIELTDSNNNKATYTLALTYKAVVTDKIILHAESKYKYIHYWQTGSAGTSKALTTESSSWNTITLNDITSTELLFSTSDITQNDWNGKTVDLSREAGEWWYKDGKWYEYNPEDTEDPVLAAFTCNATGTATGEVTFTVSATDNIGLAKLVAVLDDGSTKVAEVDISGTTYNGTFTWNSAAAANGNHKIIAAVEDASGNVSNEMTVNITTQNVNAKPVAVITGGTTVRKGSKATYNALRSSDLNGTVKGWKWEVSGASKLGDDNKDSFEVQFPDSEGKATLTLTVTDNEGAVSDPVSIPIKVKDIVSTDFREESIYFLMTTRFYDGDKSNNEYCWDEGGEYLKITDGDCAWRGDFKGLAEKLDYIKALGFSAIWITPVVENASGIDYHGYHAYDFSRVDPRYESTDFTYQDLINACHAKGIKVIQDIVLNHTGNFGERNLFHMFDKETTPYINKDVPTPAGGKRSPFMKVAKNGNAYQHLMKGLKQAGGSDYDTAIGGIQYGARINAMKEDSIDTDYIYHHAKMIDWNSENCQLGQMAGDCVDLNTENPTVYNYLIDCYTNYINMGVDGFRVDTVKHISRLTFNKTFMPAFMKAGGENFFVFGETCARYRGRWNENVPALSPSFYTWKETDGDFGWGSDHKTNSAAASAHFAKYKSSFEPPYSGTPNHLLKGNEYHKPDWSKRNHLDQIDFPMHWAFNDTGDAFNTALGQDKDYNDATFNVTYVDSHDYAPDNAPENQRFNGYWPDKLNLMFTFRGIPCIYYGSEIEFKKGMPIDPANTRTSLDGSGRAYLGDHLEGTVTATDYGEYTASGTVAQTLNHELAQHIIRLNQIRRAVPALQKGQYSTDGCSGNIAFKRRYTDNGVDSFACVAINGSATFTGLPNGTYTEVITGKTVSGSTITTDAIGQGNMRVYVLNGPGKIGKDGAYLK